MTEQSPESIHITCDRCERVLDADRTQARMECPHCGDMNVIPSAPPRNDASNEHLLLITRPALIRGHPCVAFLGTLGCLGGLLTALLSRILSAWNDIHPEWYDWVMWPGLVLGLVSGIWLAWIFIFGHRWDRLRVTSHRTIDERGIVMKSTSEVLHSHIRNIRIRQTIWQRLVRIGDIEIDGAASTKGTADIRIDNIPNPEGLKRILDANRGLTEARKL